MTSPIQRLAQISREYDQRAREFASIATDAAVAESDYRRVKAVFVTRAVNDGAAVSKAEYAADADPEVAAACQRYKLTAAVCEAARVRLRQLAAQVDVGRSAVASDREADRMHAIGGTP